MDMQTSVFRLCTTLHDPYKENIASAREKLYRHLLVRYNKDIAERARQCLEKQSTLSATPLFGEMAPWLCKKAFPVYSDKTSEQFDEILIEWLCAYLLMSVLNKEKADTRLMLPLMVEARAYLQADHAHKLALATLNSKGQVHSRNRNLHIATLIEKISAISAYPDEACVYHLTEQLSLFIQCTEDIASIQEDLENGRSSCVIRPYMVEKHIPTFAALLVCDLEPEDVMKDIRSTLNRLSTNAGSLAVIFHDRNKAINHDLQKYKSFCMGSVSYDLKSEQNFFVAVRDNAKNFADFIHTLGFKSNHDMHEDIAAEIAERMDVFSMAM